MGRNILLEEVKASAKEAALYGCKHGHSTDQKDTMEK